MQFKNGGFSIWSLKFSLKLLEQAEKTQPCANENQNWEKRKDKIKTGLVPRGAAEVQSMQSHSATGVACCGRESVEGIGQEHTDHTKDGFEGGSYDAGPTQTEGNDLTGKSLKDNSIC